MKLLIGFLQKEDAPTLLKRLREQNIAVTAIDSEGGFLRRKNTTIFLALPDEQLPGVMSTIQEVCHARTEHVDTTFATGDVEAVGLPSPLEVPVGGATVLILDIANVVKL